MKITKQTLLVMGSILVPVSILTVAASCTSTSEKKIKTINDDVEKVKLDFADKAKTLAKSITASSAFTSSDFDKEKYDLVIVNVTMGSDKKSVTVTVKLKEKTTDNKLESKSRDIIITGFKEPVTITPRRLMNKEIVNVVLDVANKKSMLASKITKLTPFTKSGYDATKYDLEIVRVDPGNSNDSVLVTVRLKDKTTGATVIESVAKVVVIKGFMNPLALKKPKQPIKPVAPAPGPEKPVPPSPIKPEKPPATQPKPQLKFDDLLKQIGIYIDAKVKELKPTQILTFAGDIKQIIASIKNIASGYGDFELNGNSLIAKINGAEMFKLNFVLLDAVKDRIKTLLADNGWKISDLTDLFNSNDVDLSTIVNGKLIKDITTYLISNKNKFEPKTLENLKKGLETKDFDFKFDFGGNTLSIKVGETYQKIITFDPEFIKNVKNVVTNFLANVANKIFATGGTSSLEKFKIQIIKAAIKSLFDSVWKGVWEIKRNKKGLVEISRPGGTTNILRLTKTELNNKIKMVTIKSKSPKTIKVADLKNTDIVFSGLDQSKFQINVKKIEPQKDGVTAKVTFTLKEIGGSIESTEATQIVMGMKPVERIGKPFTRPSNIFPDSKSVANSKYNVSIGSQDYIFDVNMDGSKSYRIPSSVKLHNGDVLVSADKRWAGSGDSGQGKIDQVFRRSKDNGLTWEPAEQIAKIAAPKTGDGLTIDGVFNEVLIDKNNPSKGYKLLYLFNIFTGHNGLGKLMTGVPFIKAGSESLWKIWVRKTDGKYEDTQYVLRKVSTKPGWWRLWQLPDGKTRKDTFVEADLKNFIPKDVYVDTTYHEDTKSITGQVYENVSDDDLKDPAKLKTKATKNSIFDDNTKTDSKYAVAVNNNNALLESYDNGKTWKNLEFIDYYWRNDPSLTHPFYGDGVGSGIQLKHQKDNKLNGRIIFPLYSWQANGAQNALYVYSDDNGKTWQKMSDFGLPANTLSESTMHETSDGTLWWFFRNSSATDSIISKSTDGGKTWVDPTGLTGDTVHRIKNETWETNVYTGFSTFNIKGVNYFVFTAPNTKGRRTNGAMFITKDWKTFDKVWEFDPDTDHSFSYSYPLTVDVGDNYADIVVAFEWNPKTSYTEITADKFRIIVNK